MPKSRVRQKKVYTPPPRSQKVQASPVWLAPAMVASWILGVLWIAFYYITAPATPLVGSLSDWNLLIGFGLIVIGIVLSTKWR